VEGNISLRVDWNSQYTGCFVSNGLIYRVPQSHHPDPDLPNLPNPHSHRIAVVDPWITDSVKFNAYAIKDTGAEANKYAVSVKDDIYFIAYNQNGLYKIQN
jgi:hypothetical protein